MRDFVIYREGYETRGWRDGRDTLHASEIIKIYTWFLWGYLKESGHLERRRRRWKDSIEKDIKELGWKDMNAIHLAGDWVLVNVLTNLHVHKTRIY
jgi:hypothetical protein